MSEREVPVMPLFDASPSEGYEVLSWQISPATVQIVGAASEVREIANVSTETVSLAGRSNSFTIPVAIDIGSANVTIKNEDRQRTLTVDIQEVQKERVIEGVPLSLGAPGGQARTFLAVTVVGPRSVVDRMQVTDIQASVSASPGSSRDAVPTVTLSPEYSDRVTVRLVEPKTVRIR
jgi:YbbR domain-containing protein